MRTIGKITNAKFIQDAKILIKSMGGIDVNTTGIDQLFSSKECMAFGKYFTYDCFLLNTTAGVLALKVDTNNSSCFTVYGRFLTVNKALPIIDNMNPYSGKWNFHSFDVNELLDNIRVSLKRITNTTVFTSYNDIDKSLTGDYEQVIIVHNGMIQTNTRLCIDDAKDWVGGLVKQGNTKNKIVIIVDGCAHLISKSSKFQLIIKK